MITDLHIVQFVPAKLVCWWLSSQSQFLLLMVDFISIEKVTQKPLCIYEQIEVCCNFLKVRKVYFISFRNENSWVLSCARFCLFVNLSLYKTYALHTNAICQKFNLEFYRFSTIAHLQ
jgi:hypothetical protein